LHDEGAILDDEILWRKDGSHFPAELRSFPLRPDGKRIGAVVSFVDITARKKAEETVRWLAAIVEASWDAIISIDAAATITSWNAGAERLYGYAAEEMIGKPISILKAEGHGDVPGIMIRRALSGEAVRDFETIGVHKNGSRMDVSLSITAIRDSGGRIRGVSGTIRDITRHRAAEEQLRLLHDIVLAAGEAVALDETLEVVLRLICQATDIPLANAWVPDSRGKLECRGHWARPEDRERFRPFVEGWSFEKDAGLPGRVWASKRPAWIANLALDANSPRAAMAEKLGIRAGVAVPILVGEELVAVIEAFLPQPGDENASLVSLLSAVGAQIGSVVQRRRIEEALRKSEEQFRQAQKMEAIGRLTGGVAHDFNNILSVILTYSWLLAEELEPDDPKRKDLLEIKAAGERAATLTHQLLAFSRRQALQPQVVDLNEIVRGMETMLQRLIGEDVELTVIHAPAAAMVNVDPGQMGQVIMNLAVNARDAMPGGGKLTIEIAAVQLEEGFVAEHAGAGPGPHMLLSISDTGCGMDAATQARVFEPFFTTKEPGKGTGLGLSTVFGIVRQSAGTIWLYSEPGKGTTFKIYLPVAEPGAEHPLLPPVSPAMLRGSETILVIEDEEGVRKLVHSILQRNGYRVVEAKSGADALRIAEQQAVIDLLLTDVIMPQMGGAETAACLLAVRPGLKVLYMSGYGENAAILHGALSPEAAFVQKPITPTALLSKVREVLDSPTAAGEEETESG
jgi:PAS domain S-box-containing protein